MSQLVFIDKNRPVTDSLTVSLVFGKDHRNVLRDIETQIEKLTEAGLKEWGVLNFEHTHYQHPQNNQSYPKFNLTEEAFTITAMSYTTPEAMKMKVRFIDEFKLLRAQQSKVTLSSSEAVAIALRQTADMMDKLPQIELKIERVEQKVDEQITLDHQEQRQLQRNISIRVYKLGVTNEERRLMFAEIHREIKDRWSVGSYCDVKRKDKYDVIRYVEAWFPRRVNNG